ncbi:MAG: hypothetical protein IPP34_14615 [Bacteroidetes bacterium]|nr:hypothetical protein [Bacteroidota bacterium]
MQFCVGDSTVLQAESGTGYSYIWKKYGNVISGATDFQYTIKSSGKYKVIIENNFGCSRISQVKTVTVINCPDIFQIIQRLQTSMKFLFSQIRLRVIL